MPQTGIEQDTEEQQKRTGLLEGKIQQQDTPRRGRARAREERVKGSRARGPSNGACGAFTPVGCGRSLSLDEWASLMDN